MQCIIKAYENWKKGGGDDWLKRLWPKIRKAVEFCWVPGGWDADVDGVMEGCQHNTMDVEYYGPNPQMEFLYLNRYDGRKRNPFDEAECGHHYSRALDAWSVFKAFDDACAKSTPYDRISTESKSKQERER